MSQEIIQFRICDRCWGDEKEVEASVTDRFTLNGHKFALDLCDEHSAELYQLLMHTWGDLGIKTGEPGFLDKPVRITPTMGQPSPTTRERPQLTVVPAPVERVREFPPTAERWSLSAHALERMAERGFDIRQVLWAAEQPEQVTRSRKNPQLMEHVRAGCLVVVSPEELRVVTVAKAETHRQKVEA